MWITSRGYPWHDGKHPFCPQGLFSFLTFFRQNFCFSRPSVLTFPAPTNCPWVSEDGSSTARGSDISFLSRWALETLTLKLINCIANFWRDILWVLIFKSFLSSSLKLWAQNVYSYCMEVRHQKKRQPWLQVRVVGQYTMLTADRVNNADCRLSTNCRLTRKTGVFFTSETCQHSIYNVPIVTLLSRNYLTTFLGNVLSFLSCNVHYKWSNKEFIQFILSTVLSFHRALTSSSRSLYYK